MPVEVPAGELTQLHLQVLQPTVTEAEAQELKQVNCKLHFIKRMGVCVVKSLPHFLAFVHLIFQLLKKDHPKMTTLLPIILPIIYSPLTISNLYKVVQKTQKKIF